MQTVKCMKTCDGFSSDSLTRVHKSCRRVNPHSPDPRNFFEIVNYAHPIAFLVWCLQNRTHSKFIAVASNPSIMQRHPFRASRNCYTQGRTPTAHRHYYRRKQDNRIQTNVFQTRQCRELLKSVAAANTHF